MSTGRSFSEPDVQAIEYLQRLVADRLLASHGSVYEAFRDTGTGLNPNALAVWWREVEGQSGNAFDCALSVAMMAVEADRATTERALPMPSADVSKPWRQDPDIGPQALEVAQALCRLAREHLGTYTFDYGGYQRVVVTRDSNRGITARFLTCKSPMSAVSIVEPSRQEADQ